MSDGVRALAAATLLASFRGPVVPEWARRRVDEGLGGVCLFGSNLRGVESAGEVSAALHGVRPSVLVAIDEEGGDVTRIEARTGSSVPGNAALGAVDDVALTWDVFASLGRVLVDAGIDLDLAPCADVNVDAANPVIGVRSFGADPGLVARHVAAAVRGLQGVGVAACAKHFPGHGATTVDSHLALPVVDVPEAVVLGRELAPFRAAIAAGVAAVMTAHLLVPAFDDRPATVSRPLLVDLLRDELGFTGAVVTDALDMHGIGGPAAIPANVVRALAAGVDLCCLGSGGTDELVGACLDAVVAAVGSGALPEGRLAEAAARVAGIPVAGEGLSPGDLGELGADAARRALRVEGDLPDLRGAHVVEIRRPTNIAAGDVPSGLAAHLPAPTSAPDDGGSAPLIVVVRDVRVVPDGPERLAALLAERPDAVVVDLGWPSGEPLQSRARVSTFGASRASLAAVADLLTTTSTRKAHG
ncbi:MAG TPA: glycoside hydrolase family 3 N-terminal domain-containing protein [Acidimicrobiales bacterium]|nr:glycoside hydrolase family 3 N-terminal domain-containing protein [Acidimicrobiales bacterium]